MTTRMLCLLMATSTFLLTACGRDKGEPPATSQREMAAASAAFTTPSVDPSMPTAPAVLQGRANAPQDPASGARAPDAIAGSKGSAWVPMAGQNNDHSAPLQPASAASAR